MLIFSYILATYSPYEKLKVPILTKIRGGMVCSHLPYGLVDNFYISSWIAHLEIVFRCLHFSFVLYCQLRLPLQGKSRKSNFDFTYLDWEFFGSRI